MTRIRLFRSFVTVVLALVGLINTAIAQQDADMLSGYWKQEKASVYIHVVNSGNSYEGEVVRNDWNPGLVGRKYFHKVVRVDGRKNRWVGEASITDSDKTGKATLRINRSGELVTTLRPGGRTTWLRSEPVEKRY